MFSQNILSYRKEIAPGYLFKKDWECLRYEQKGVYFSKFWANWRWYPSKQHANLKFLECENAKNISKEIFRVGAARNNCLQKTLAAIKIYINFWFDKDYVNSEDRKG